jgi:hypothetical protein
MRYKLLNILFFAVLISLACREKFITDDNGLNSGLAGDYTEISGNLSGTLSLTDSPFLVTGDLNIKSSDTLIIEAGVTLFFKNDKKITVSGTLVAEGSGNQMIVFRSFGDTNEDWWLGIRILNPITVSKFKFCVIEHVNQNRNDQFTNGALEIINSQVIVKNCVIRTNYSILGGGFSAFNSNIILINNIFRENYVDDFGGAIYLQNSTSVIVNNTIYRNTCYNFGGGIVLTNPLSTEIQNNIFYNNISPKGNRRIAIESGDSSNVMKQYNFPAEEETDPMFISHENLQLSPQSPCIDQGNPEPQYNDVNGSRNDQGAFGGPGGDW